MTVGYWVFATVFLTWYVFWAVVYPIVRAYDNHIRTLLDTQRELRECREREMR